MDSLSLDSNIPFRRSRSRRNRLDQFRSTSTINRPPLRLPRHQLRSPHPCQCRLPSLLSPRSPKSAWKHLLHQNRAVSPLRRARCPWTPNTGINSGLPEDSHGTAYLRTAQSFQHVLPRVADAEEIFVVVIPLWPCPREKTLSRRCRR